jgi:hypothetical protein
MTKRLTYFLCLGCKEIKRTERKGLIQTRNTSICCIFKIWRIKFLPFCEECHRCTFLAVDHGGYSNGNVIGETKDAEFFH